MHQFSSALSTWCKVGFPVGRTNGMAVILLIFTLSASPLYGQLAPNTDSLNTLLKDADGEQRVTLLHQLSEQVRRTSIDSAILHAREALQASRRLDNTYLEGQSRNNLGRLLSNNSMYPEALKHLLQAKNIFEQVGNLQKEALALQNLGKLYKSQSNYSKALEYYFSALHLQEQLSNRERTANILLSIGSVHYQMDQPEESILFYRRALKISEELDNFSDIAITATALGSVYSEMGQTGQALKAYNKALDASDKLPGLHAKATILMNISSVYNEENSYRQALEVNDKALTLAREMSDKVLESWALENIAITHRGLQQFSKANTYLQHALSIVNEVNYPQNVVETKNRIAQNYLDMGQFGDAVSYAEEAASSAARIKAYEELIESLQMLSKAFKQNKDYESALSVQTRLMAVKDTLNSRQQSRQIAEMQTRYETKQKEQEIVLLQKEKKNAQLIRNAFIAGLILIIIISILIYNRQRLKIKKNKTDLENTRLKELQLKKDLEFKNKQLTTHSLHLVQKNEAMKELKDHLAEIKNEGENNLDQELQNLENLIDYSFNLDEDWEEFRLYFEEVHTGFFKALKTRYSDLTPNEFRLSALVKLNLTTKEIATIMSITPDSVKTARYRLRKKLNMETEENLTEFMMGIEKKVSGRT